MSDTDGITFRIIEEIGVVTIDRVSRMNALRPRDSRDMDNILAGLDADPEVRVVIIVGAGDRAFCAGADLRAEADDGPRVSFGAITGVAGPMRTLRTPTIAAVRGHAIGGGFELVAACDIVVAGTGALFSMPEGTIGQVAESPVGHRAVRQLPYHVAMDMALTGRKLTADEALRYGFVNYLVADDQVLATALDVARSIASSSPLALQAFKHALTTSAEIPLELALSRRFEPVEEYQRSADHAEMLRAARERRAPRWRGT